MICLGTNTLEFFGRENIPASTTKVSVIRDIPHKLSAQSHKPPPPTQTPLAKPRFSNVFLTY